MDTIRVKSKTDTEIVFASVDDMARFYDDLMNGKSVIVTYSINSVKKSELLIPSLFTPINDGKIKLSSEEAD